MNNLRIKSPDSPDEIAGMWQLNHEVFARELKQHEVHEDGLLRDKFHDKNIYRIAITADSQVVGMVCAHWQPPYSAVAKFGAALTPWLNDKTAEIRLFTVAPAYRHTTTLAVRLGTAILTELYKRGLQQVVISGIAAQKEFYEHIGFKIIGIPVRDGEAVFYPMFADINELLTRRQLAAQRLQRL